MTSPIYEERTPTKGMTVNRVAWTDHRGYTYEFRLYSHKGGTTGLRLECGSLETDIPLPADVVELMTAAMGRANALAHAEEAVA